MYFHSFVFLLLLVVITSILLSRGRAGGAARGPVQKEQSHSYRQGYNFHGMETSAPCIYSMSPRRSPGYYINIAHVTCFQLSITLTWNAACVENANGSDVCLETWNVLAPDVVSRGPVKSNAIDASL